MLALLVGNYIVVMEVEIFADGALKRGNIFVVFVLIIFITGWNSQYLIGIIFFEVGVDEGFKCCCPGVKVVPDVAKLTDRTE